MTHDIDPRVAERMGYEEIVACAQLEASFPIEVALLRPTDDFPRWRTVHHSGIDPEVPDAGVSEIVDHEDEAAARRAYEAYLEHRPDEPGAEVPVP